MGSNWYVAHMFRRRDSPCGQYRPGTNIHLTGLAQLFLGGTLASYLGRLWALRVSIAIMVIGVVVQVVPNTFGVLLLGRLLTGLGFGCVYIATSLYGTKLSISLYSTVWIIF